MKKRLLSIFLVIILVMQMVPFSAQAATVSYNANAALSYAAGHVYDGKGLCAEYVSDCISAGGLSSYSVNCIDLHSQLVREVVNTGYAVEYSLDISNGTNYVTALGNNAGKVKPGDVLFWYCGSCGQYMHVALVGGTDSDGDLTVYAHNSEQNNTTAWIGRCYSTTYHNGNGPRYSEMKVIHFTGNSQSIPWPSKPVINCTPQGSNKLAFTWNGTTNTTQYHVVFYKLNTSNGVYEQVERVVDAKSGVSRSFGIGKYRVMMQSYNENYWMEQDYYGSHWPFTQSDYQYFTVTSTGTSAGEWSAWTSTPISASTTLEVETKNHYLYHQYIFIFSDGSLGTYPLDESTMKHSVNYSGMGEPFSLYSYREYASDTQLSRMVDRDGTLGKRTYYVPSKGATEEFLCYEDRGQVDNIQYKNGLFYKGTQTLYRSRTKAISVTGVSLNKTATTLTVGGSETLTATVAPTNAANKNVTWSSSNTSVATVSTAGVVTAKAAGTATITVKTADGNKTATCTVTVQEKQSETVTTVSITDIKVNLTQEKEFAVDINLTDNAGFADLEIEVGYDSSVLTLVEVSDNSEVGCTFAAAQTLEKNPYNMAWTNYENIIFNGRLATLTFVVKDGVEEGTTAITLDYYKGRNGDNVDGDDINFDEAYEPIRLYYEDATVTLVKSIPGDIDGNGKVNSKDTVCLMQYLAGWDVTIDDGASDVDNNSKINSRDTICLMQYFAGWDVTLG